MTDHQSVLPENFGATRVEFPGETQISSVTIAKHGGGVRASIFLADSDSDFFHARVNKICGMLAGLIVEHAQKSEENQ